MFSLNLRLLITSCFAIDCQHTSCVCFTYHLKSISCNENMKKYSQSSQLTDALVVFGVVAALRNTRHDSFMLITFLERVIYSFLRFGDAPVDGDCKISINFQPTSLVTLPYRCGFVRFSFVTMKLWRFAWPSTLRRHPTKEVPEAHRAAHTRIRCHRWPVNFPRFCTCRVIESHRRWDVTGERLFDPLNHVGLKWCGSQTFLVLELPTQLRQLMKVDVVVVALVNRQR